jgi:ornithine cyclodeaminase
VFLSGSQFPQFSLATAKDQVFVMQLLDVSATRRLLNAVGIEQAISELAGYIEGDFQRWSEFEKCPRVASHSRVGVIELMPTSDGVEYCFKYVNGHPQNVAIGLQTVTAFGVLASVATGYPELLAEMTIVTALRTAATSALAARYLARPDSQTMAIIGLGAQSEFQALGFRALLGIRRLRVFDVDKDATRKFIRNMQSQGFEIVAAETAEDAVRGVDIVTTVTADKARNHILSDNMIGEGVHINAVGGDCPGKTELQAELLRRSTVVVEYAPQTRIEGEIQQLPADFPVTELWQVLVGDVRGRSRRQEITVFDSVGFAVEDFSALRFLRDKANVLNLYKEINILAKARDPRDLYGLLLSDAT